jgi:3-hydroxybutyryl-CoA dehydrogenase
VSGERSDKLPTQRDLPDENSAVTQDAAQPEIIGLVGAGAMGRGIMQIAAQAGFEVKLFDAAEGAAEQARRSVSEQFERLRQKGRMTGEAIEQAVSHLRPVADLAALSDSAIVIEAIVENLDAKRDLFRKLDAIVGPDCILATNTSSLSVTAIAAATAKPERVAGLHFFNPVPLMKLAEVISGALTASETAARLTDFTRRVGHTPVQAQDTPGFIVNHAGRGYVTEALKILQESVADHETVDIILREAAGFRLGPFQLLDLTGLDVSHPVMDSIYQQYFQEPRYRPSVIAAQRLAAGLLGRKTARGFYRYEKDGTPSQSQESAHQSEGEVWNRSVWLSSRDNSAREEIVRLLSAAGVAIETAEAPSESAACVVTPLGEDVSACVVREDLDPARTVGLDAITECAGRITLMCNPATDRKVARQMATLFHRAGLPASIIEDSAGFVVQRVLAMIVNIGCDIVQQGICSPEDLDRAVVIGLGYPRGPLAWGNALGPGRVLTILQNMHRLTGDPRYRPSPWLLRRAQLGISLHHLHG